MIRPRSIVVLLLRFYQRWISPAFGPRCRYYPSCSEYAVQAVERFGILRGAVLAGWRLLRCNPWSHGGFDPVEDQRLFPLKASVLNPRSSAPAQPYSSSGELPGSAPQAPVPSA